MATNLKQRKPRRSTVNTCRSITIKSLKDRGVLNLGQIAAFMIEWQDGCSVSFFSVFTEKEKYLELEYTSTDKRTGIATPHRYRVYYSLIPSNLGKGYLVYFICPQTGENCRTLYNAYGSDLYKSREAYSTRLYYPAQLSSKRWLDNTKYFNIVRRLEKTKGMRDTGEYNGQDTKRLKRNAELFVLKAKYDERRTAQMAVALLSQYPHLARKFSANP